MPAHGMLWDVLMSLKGELYSYEERFRKDVLKPNKTNISRMIWDIDHTIQYIEWLLELYGDYEKPFNEDDANKRGHHGDDL